MLFALTPLLLLALSQDPDASWQHQTTEDLVAIVQEERDRTDPALFDELARRSTDDAFEALRRCSSLLTSEDALNAVFEAAARFARLPEEEGPGRLARTWLGEVALGQDWSRRRPAARALSSLGTLALDELRAVLRGSPDARCREIACGGLVPALEFEGNREALDQLLSWYRSPTSGPPARLIRTLARFDGDWVISALEEAIGDSSRPASVRRAVVLSLSRRPGAKVDELLLEALQARDPAVQLAGVEALADRGDVGQLRTLEKLARGRDDVVRRAAFVAIDTLRAGDADWEKELAKAAIGRDLALRLAAVQLYGRRPGDEALAALVLLVGDKSHLVRLLAVRALAPRRTKSTLSLLLDVLAGDPLRVRLAAREVLVELTGQDHGPTAVRWRAWWKAEGATFELPKASDAASANALRERRKRENPTQAAFYGISLGSDRVCFVLDTSGSMDGLMYTGGTRLEAAVEELIQALEAFPAPGRFNLVFFASRVTKWKSSLVEMDDGKLSKAARFARAQRANGGTALYDALIEALEDEDVDTIVVLSDGQPTEGELIEGPSILADIQHRNRLRGVVFHCVALNFQSDLLEGLAAASDGVYRTVR